MTSSGYQFTTRSFQGVPVHVKRRMINCTDEEVSMETVPIMSLNAHCYARCLVHTVQIPIYSVSFQITFNSSLDRESSNLRESNPTNICKWRLELFNHN